MKTFMYPCTLSVFWRALRYTAAHDGMRLDVRGNRFRLYVPWEPRCGSMKSGLFDQLTQMRFYGKVTENGETVLVSGRLRNPLWIYCFALLPLASFCSLAMSWFDFWSSCAECAYLLFGLYLISRLGFRKENRAVLARLSSLTSTLEEGISLNA